MLEYVFGMEWCPSVVMLLFYNQSVWSKHKNSSHYHCLVTKPTEHFQIALISNKCMWLKCILSHLGGIIETKQTMYFNKSSSETKYNIISNKVLSWNKKCVLQSHLWINVL